MERLNIGRKGRFPTLKERCATRDDYISMTKMIATTPSFARNLGVFMKIETIHQIYFGTHHITTRLQNQTSVLPVNPKGSNYFTHTFITIDRSR